MRDMDMEPNQYQLVPNAKQEIWHARIILPACITGCRDWLMIIYENSQPIGQMAFHSE